jgi:cold shock protein
MPTGVVSFFSSERGYGFIESDNGGPDVFVHVKEVRGKRELQNGERVEFDIATDEQRGKAKAIGVRVL